MPSGPRWLSDPLPGLRVWALEPYYGGSHRAFLDGFRAHSAHDLRLHVLPGRHWKWRMHGGALALAQQARQAQTEGVPQVLFASDMLDVAAYRGLAPGPVARAPVALYFHENQLTYPLPEGVERDLGYGMTHLTSALVADRVLFNSAFHRAEFLAALRGFVEGLPDEQPFAAVEEVAHRAEVLPLGVDLARFDRCRPRSATGRWGEPARGPLVLWNQRWEYDKDPAAFFGALYALQEQQVPFRVAVAGANQGLPTQVFVEARKRLEGHLVQWGRLESFADYAALLWEADVVVSTALHEFFGTAVVEAVYCGCRPVLPCRLSYPELMPEEIHDEVLYDKGRLVPLLLRALAEGRPWSGEWQRTWVSPYDWGRMAARYDEMLWSCWERSSATRISG